MPGSEVVDTTIAFASNSISSSAFQKLFGGENMYEPILVDGKTKDPINPPEGEVGQPIIEQTSAIVTGQVNVYNGLIITDETNTLSFNLNAADYSVQLNNGTYSKRAS